MTHLAKILLVDDDPIVQKATCLALEAAGYQVSIAATGADGLYLAQRQIPDLILLDRVLPDTDGLEICRQLKAEPATAGCFVVLLSGLKISTTEQVGGLEAGADGYIARPISNRELLARIEAMLRIKRAEDSAAAERNRLASIVEHSADAIISVSLNGQVLTWNQGAERLLGRSEVEAKGQPILAVAPLEQPEKLSAALTIIQHGEAAVQLHALPLAGEKDKERVYVSITVSPVKGSGEQLVGISLIGRDVTEQVRLQAVREREMTAWEDFSGPVRAAITAESFGVSRLSQFDPSLFARLIQQYEQALQHSWENKVYRVHYPVSDELRTIAESLGRAQAGPRDVVQLHLAALKSVGKGLPIPKIQAYAEEGRLLIVELMGYLTAYYRNYFLGSTQSHQTDNS